jgi:hypothetical protein
MGCDSGGGYGTMIPADSLRVHDFPRMIRLGRPNDGGYCVADIQGYDHFLSGGINGENSFEIAVLERYPNLTCYAFDPVNSPGQAHPRYEFIANNVGYFGLFTYRNALVKLDIERAEWPWLATLLDSDLSHIAQMVLELHSPHVPESGWDWAQLARLSSTHALIHLHGNNWDGMVEAGGTRMPGTIETTWLRWDLAGKLPRRSRPIPDALDQVNDPSKPDHVVDWEPFVESSRRGGAESGGES